MRPALQARYVPVTHEVLEHNTVDAAVATRLAVAVASSSAKLYPLRVAMDPPESAWFGADMDETNGASKVKAVVDVPTNPATESDSSGTLSVPAVTAHSSAVVLTHDVVPQRVLPSAADGVASATAKLKPATVTLSPPDAAELGRKREVTTGESNERTKAPELTSRPTVTEGYSAVPSSDATAGGVVHRTIVAVDQDAVLQNGCIADGDS